MLNFVLAHFSDQCNDIIKNMNMAHSFDKILSCFQLFSSFHIMFPSTDVS